jgi:hypothetical protein
MVIRKDDTDKAHTMIIEKSFLLPERILGINKITFVSAQVSHERSFR